MDKSNMSQKERKEYICILPKILEYTKDKPTVNEFILIKGFAEYLTNEYDKGSTYALEKLYNRDMDNSIKLLNTIQDFSVRNKIHFIKTFNTLLVFSEIQLNNLNNYFKKEKLNSNNLDEDVLMFIQGIRGICESEVSFYSALSKRFSEVVEYAKSTGNISETDLMVYQTVLNDSYDEIKKQVFCNAANIKLPLEQNNIKPMKVIQEIEGEQSIFNNLFNTRAIGQMKGNNHFMSYILNDKMVATDNGNIIFKGHTKALSIGYTQKAIMLSFDKNRTIRELETGLRFLKKQTHENIQEIIEFNEKLIQIIKQRKYANIVTFKVLAKEMDISKNQVKRYAKQLFSINDNTFDTKFDEIIVHNFTD